MTPQEFYCLIEAINKGEFVPENLFKYFLTVLNLNTPRNQRSFEPFCAFVEKYDSDTEKMAEAINSAMTAIVSYFDNSQELTAALANTALTDISIYEKYLDFDKKLCEPKVGHVYLDFDLTQATTQAFNYANPTILNGTWKEFVSRFVDDEYLINGRYLRMGSCGWFGFKTLKTRHAEFIKNVCQKLICKIFDIKGNKFLNELLSNSETPITNIFCDTVQFDVTALEEKGALLQEDVDSVIKDFKEQFDIDAHYSCYKNEIKPCSKQYCGELILDTIPCKTEIFDGKHIYISHFFAFELPQLYKLVNNVPVNEDDIAVARGEKIDLLQ